MLADIVDKEGADGTAVVGGRDGPVPLLAGGIPDLSFDRFRVDLDGARSELDANRGLGVYAELIAGEPTEQVGFSDARVSDQDNWGLRWLVKPWAQSFRQGRHGSWRIMARWDRAHL